MASSPLDDRAQATAIFEAHASRLEGRDCMKGRPSTHAIPKKKEFNRNLLFPLVYAGILPAIRIGLRGRLPQPTIDKIFGGAIAVGLGHAAYMMASESSV